MEKERSAREDYEKNPLNPMNGHENDQVVKRNNISENDGHQFPLELWEKCCWLKGESQERGEQGKGKVSYLR